MLIDPDGDRSIDENEYNLLMKQFSSLLEENRLKIRIKQKNWFHTDYSFIIIGATL